MIPLSIIKSKYIQTIIKWKSMKKGLYHHKFIVIDDKFVMNGSYNLSNYAEKFNYENMMITSDQWAVE